MASHRVLTFVNVSEFGVTISDLKETEYSLISACSFFRKRFLLLSSTLLIFLRFSFSSLAI